VLDGSWADPDGLQRPVDVASDDGAYRLVVVAVPDEPAADVGEVLGGILHPIDVRDGFEIRPAGRAQAEQVGEDPVQLDVEGVRAERDMLDADQIDALAEVVHDRLDRVAGMHRGQGGVRAADIPITPPVSATARSTSSGFIRKVSQTARAPA
jgi:hypothetical protein